MFVPLFLPSPQTASDGVVCLRKIHLLLHNILIINIDKFLQRGGVLISLFRRSFPGRDIGDKKEERSQDRSLFVVEVVLREGPELPSCNRVKHGGRESPEPGRKPCAKGRKTFLNGRAGPFRTANIAGNFCSWAEYFYFCRSETLRSIRRISDADRWGTAWRGRAVSTCRRG